MKNVLIDNVRATLGRSKVDEKVVQIPMDITGEWRMDEHQPQFGGNVKLASGEIVMFESDFPPFLGGQGRKPTPLMYCFWGGMSCFASTFALAAALEGIEISSLSVRMTGLVDFHQGLGIGDQPPISDLRWDITVESEADQETLDRLLLLAEERCPASWMMKNVVPLSVGIARR